LRRASRAVGTSYNTAGSTASGAAPGGADGPHRERSLMSSYERDDYEQPRDSSASSARDRVNLPGIFLIVVGIMNILGAIYPIANGLLVLLASEQFLTEIMASNPLVPKGSR
jgi:hypothetical protein